MQFGKEGSRQYDVVTEQQAAVLYPEYHGNAHTVNKEKYNEK